MKFVKFHAKVKKKNKKTVISHQNHENHELHKIPGPKIENNKKKKQIFHCGIMNIKKFIEFESRITKTKKI